MASSASGPASAAAAPAGDECEFVVGGDQDAGVPGQRRQDGAGFVPGPQLAAVVDVEGHHQAFGGAARGSVFDRAPGVRGRGRR